MTILIFIDHSDGHLGCGGDRGLFTSGYELRHGSANIHLKKEPYRFVGLSDVPRILGQWEAVGDDQRLSEFIEELEPTNFC